MDSLTKCLKDILPDFCWLSMRDIREMAWLVNPDFDHDYFGPTIIHLLKKDFLERKAYSGCPQGARYVERTYRPRFLYKKKTKS